MSTTAWRVRMSAMPASSTTSRVWASSDSRPRSTSPSRACRVRAGMPAPAVSSWAARADGPAPMTRQPARRRRRGRCRGCRSCRCRPGRSARSTARDGGEPGHRCGLVGAQRRPRRSAAVTAPGSIGAVVSRRVTTSTKRSSMSCSSRLVNQRRPSSVATASTCGSAITNAVIRSIVVTVAPRPSRRATASVTAVSVNVVEPTVRSLRSSSLIHSSGLTTCS